MAENWNDNGKLFTPTGKDLHRVKLLPLWHGSSKERCQEILHSGFTYLGKRDQISAEVGADEVPKDAGYFGNGFYFTNSAKYASQYSSVIIIHLLLTLPSTFTSDLTSLNFPKKTKDQNLILAFVSMREPFPVINDSPHPEKGSDMILLEGNGPFENFNAHFIPVAPLHPENPDDLEFYPCYKDQNPLWDEVVVFTQAQILAKYWVQLRSCSEPLDYSTEELLAAVQFGCQYEVENWISEDPSRIKVADEETGETLFYLALIGNHVQMMEFLLQQDPLQARTLRKDKKSLFFLAILGQRKEILDLLIKYLGQTYSSNEFASEAREMGLTDARIDMLLLAVGWNPGSLYSLCFPILSYPLFHLLT